MLRASLLTVMRHPELTICEVPLLLLNDGFRAALTKDLDDRIGLRPFWSEYEQLSPAQRLQMIGPVLNKLRAFLLRPTVRNILGQSRSTVKLREVMDGSGILLVSLAKGLLGEDISRLLGAFVVARIWQAALSRISMPANERPDFNLYLDEFQNYLYLPQSLDHVLAEARAYGLNLTVANQHYGQLRELDARGDQRQRSDPRHLPMQPGGRAVSGTRVLPTHRAAGPEPRAFPGGRQALHRRPYSVALHRRHNRTAAKPWSDSCGAAHPAQLRPLRTAASCGRG